MQTYILNCYYRYALNHIKLTDLIKWLLLLLKLIGNKGMKLSEVSAKFSK